VRTHLELDPCILPAHKVCHLVLIEPYIENLDGHPVGHDEELVARRDGALLDLRVEAARDRGLSDSFDGQSYGT
jgi:hypothetical protein